MNKRRLMTCYTTVHCKEVKKRQTKNYRDIGCPHSSKTTGLGRIFPFPSLEKTANTLYLSRASAIIRDCTHLGYHLFNSLPSGTCYRLLKPQTNRLKNIFFPTVICTFNGLSYTRWMFFFSFLFNNNNNNNKDLHIKLILGHWKQNEMITRWYYDNKITE